MYPFDRRNPRSRVCQRGGYNGGCRNHSASTNGGEFTATGKRCLPNASAYPRRPSFSGDLTAAADRGRSLVVPLCRARIFNSKQRGASLPLGSDPAADRTSYRPKPYGPVLGTDPNGGQVTVTPIYWAPAGYSFTQSYQNVVNGYLNNVATDSGKPTNVFSVATQYTDAAGNPIRYHLSEDSAIVDATAPAGGGCTPDSGAIYADYTPYTSCIDDAQLQGEINTVLATHGLVSDQTHMYLVFLPKGVESCFTSANGAAGGDCSTNPSSATTGKGFCGYHSATTSNSGVYSDLAFPIYSSPTNFGCGPQVPGGAGSAISER